MQQDLERLIRLAAQRRKYAVFFEWPDKELKELGIVRQVVESLREQTAIEIADPRVHKPDPPDVICLDPGGGEVAVEVVEVVSEDARRLNAQAQAVFRIWRPGELRAHVEGLLEEKDRKRYSGGPYSSIDLCLFTDESALLFTDATRDFANATLGPYNQIARAYLLFSYDPHKQRYPVLQLPLSA